MLLNGYPRLLSVMSVQVMSQTSELGASKQQIINCGFVVDLCKKPLHDTPLAWLKVLVWLNQDVLRRWIHYLILLVWSVQRRKDHGREGCYYFVDYRWFPSVYKFLVISLSPGTMYAIHLNSVWCLAYALRDISQIYWCGEYGRGRSRPYI